LRSEPAAVEFVMPLSLLDRGEEFQPQPDDSAPPSLTS
jgi:hypothetical protein